jgi:hypothetical protein
MEQEHHKEMSGQSVSVCVFVCGVGLHFIFLDISNHITKDHSTFQGTFRMQEALWTNPFLEPYVKPVHFKFMHYLGANSNLNFWPRRYPAHW